MANSVSIRLKALFLLIMFSLNMPIGFASAVEINIAFNTFHHHKETASSIHVLTNDNNYQPEKTKHPHSRNDKNDDSCHDKVLKIGLRYNSMLCF